MWEDSPSPELGPFPASFKRTHALTHERTNAPAASIPCSGDGHGSERELVKLAEEKELEREAQRIASARYKKEKELQVRGRDVGKYA